MAAAARVALTQLPLDAEFGVPVPFACTRDFAAGGGGTVRRVNHKRVPQCALSRICGMCGETLGRPVAFLGTELEVGRNAFHFPPMHVDCAETAQTLYVDLPADALGIGDREAFGELGSEPHEPWVLITTSGFEFVRPNTQQVDRRPVFEPNSRLS
jgi:hypothetical protein